MSSNQVILGVKAGRGFDFLSKSFIIEANLNGHTIKTDLLAPSHNITIGAELLWQAEKKVLKRLRIGNVPLKVECFPMVNGKKEERMGFILLTLRAAKIIGPNSVLSDASGRWHNLLGLKKNVKSYNPSLLLTLHIEDMGITDCWKEITVSNSPLSKYVVPLISPKKSITFNGSQQQLTRTFLMTVTLESAGDLHLLVEYPNQPDGDFALSCDIMGCAKQERNISELSSLVLDIDCKFTVKVPGSLESLLNYLQQKELAFIALTSKGNEIAYCHVNGSYLISEEMLRTFNSQDSFNNILSTRRQYSFIKTSTQEIPVSESGSSPFIEAALTLQYLYDDNRVVGQGDAESCNVVLSLYEPNNLYSDTNRLLWNLKDMYNSDVDNDLQSSHQSMHEWVFLNFILESIHLQTSCGNRFYIRVAQASAAVAMSPRGAIAAGVAFAGTAASLLLPGDLDDVRREVALRRPTLTLLVAGGGDGATVALAAGEVNVAPLFAREGSCLSVVQLRSPQGAEVGTARLRLALEEVAVAGWGAHAQAALPESYITEPLDARSPEMPAKESESQENNERDLSIQELPPTPSTLEVEYQMKLQECREASRRMEDDFKLEVSRLQTENKHLLDQIALQENENVHLLKIKQDLENELEKLRRNSLTEDQIAGILKDLKLAEEKYEIAYRSKIFFKEQWARAMREIHIIKSRYRDEMNMQIRYNREELRNLGRMLPPCEGPAAPQPPGAPTPAPSPAPAPATGPAPGPDGDGIGDALGDAAAPHAQKKRTNDDLQKSSLEFKLQELVQQRDSLLNTGTYALDHHLINMLNKQIRQLLADSTHKFE